MRILCQLNHPAHYHLFKHVVAGLRREGNEVCIVVRDKDILLDLTRDEEVINIAPKYRSQGGFSIACDLARRDCRLFEVARKWKPDLMVGTAIEISHVGRVLNIPSIFLGEDDARLVLWGSLINKPLCTYILSPASCDNWIWNRKTIFYAGFQKLAYLHPRFFTPTRDRVKDLGESYSLLRLSALAAHHDGGRQGLGAKTVREVIEVLKKRGNVFITSEKPLDPDLEPYRYRGNVQDIHHALYYSNMFIGDSQSMAMEAAMLGVPNVRVSDFVGRIGVLNEVEEVYRLSIGIKPDDPIRFRKVVEALSEEPLVRAQWQKRRLSMLNEKISVTDFFVWLMGGYPDSIDRIRRDPEYQFRFRTPMSLEVSRGENG